MGLFLVFGNDVDTFYNTLLERESGSSLIHRFDASPFFCYIDGKHDRRLDDCWRYCLVAGKRALEDANLGTEILESMDRSKIGILVGTGMGGLTAFSSGFESLLQKGSKKITPGEADIMVVGGIEAAIIPIGVGGFIACRALSQKNGEPQKLRGCGIEIAASCSFSIIAEYLGGAVTCDTHHMTETVNYINAHATSTLAGDLAEVNAIKKVFKSTSEIKMNGTKSMIGHGLGAAGGLEAIATIKAITTGWLHPTINQDNLESDVTIDTAPNVKKQHEVHVGMYSLPNTLRSVTATSKCLLHDS
ncbi:hypothetical protein MKW92_014349 [Papaver armeniacum]|nr:hypothetical protein MKW92_014349 [Papaver armeniacum]